MKTSDNSRSFIVILWMIIMFHTVYCISDDPCIYHKKGVFWDIGKLKEDNAIQIDGPDGATIEFNICEQVS